MLYLCTVWITCIAGRTRHVSLREEEEEKEYHPSLNKSPSLDCDLSFPFLLDIFFNNILLVPFTYCD